MFRVKAWGFWWCPVVDFMLIFSKVTDFRLMQDAYRGLHMITVPFSRHSPPAGFDVALPFAELRSLIGLQPL